MLFKNLLIFCLALLTAQSALATPPKSFYEEKARGWFWHEPEIEEEEPDYSEPSLPEVTKKESEDTDEKSTDKEMISINVQWIRDNFDTLRDDAINNPTTENVAAFAYAQRVMLDYGSRFSSKMIDFISLEPALDESNRRPTNGMALSSFKRETNNTIYRLIDKIATQKHLWFFYSSSCPYCAQMVPAIKEFSRQTEMKILLISMDGGVLPGTENMDIVFDTDLYVSTKFGVRATPSIFLANNDGSEFLMIKEGLSTIPEMQNLILRRGKLANLINDEEYQQAQKVRELNIFKNEVGELTAPKNEIENDRGYLADMLRAKLEQAKPYGASSIEGMK